MSDTSDAKNKWPLELIGLHGLKLHFPLAMHA